jgi:hypothetical protein
MADLENITEPTVVVQNNDIDDNINDNINDNIDDNIDSVNTKSKTNKKTFDEECTRCHKHFKAKETFKKHVLQQLCYSRDEISYCKICNITLESHTGYIKHLMTLKHLECINAGKLERLNDDRPGIIHTADPYLSRNEAELLGTRNLGEKYTLVFENNEIQDVKLVRKPSPPVGISSSIKISETESTAPDRIAQPTNKQINIIQYLEKQKNPIEANNSFIKILTTKLELEDYYGLTTIIRDNPNISLEVKKTILNLINKFVEGLTKKRAGGQTTYNNKDIAKVVVALSI